MSILNFEIYRHNVDIIYKKKAKSCSWAGVHSRRRLVDLTWLRWAGWGGSRWCHLRTPFIACPGFVSISAEFGGGHIHHAPTYFSVWMVLLAYLATFWKVLDSFDNFCILTSPPNSLFDHFLDSFDSFCILTSPTIGGDVRNQMFQNLAKSGQIG